MQSLRSLKQLQQLFIDLTKTTEPDTTTLPDEKDDKELIDGLKNINQLFKSETWQTKSKTSLTT
jgi:hypothetical protein